MKTHAFVVRKPRTLLSTTTWRSHWQSPCKLFDCCNLSSLSIALDYMHNVYLGWQMHCYGSVLTLLTEDLLPEDCLANLKTVAAWIRAFQKNSATKHPYRHKLDKVSMFKKKKGFPKLKGRAADIRGLDQTMYMLWQQHRNPEDPRHAQISLLLQTNMEIGQILDEFSPRYGFMAVPGPQANELEQKGRLVAQLTAQLMDYYKGVHRQLFNFTAKLHFTIHSLQLSKFIHPALVWCFKGESNMKTVQRMWKSCLEGRNHWRVSKNAALKYRHLLHLKRAR